MPSDKYKLTARLTLPVVLRKQLLTMAHERDMTIHELVGELVILGLARLDYPDVVRDETLKGIDPCGDRCDR